MAIVRVQHVENDTAGSAFLSTTIAPSLMGSLIVALIKIDPARSVDSVSDNQGNVYVFATGSRGTGPAKVETWYSTNSIAGVTSVLLNSNGTNATIFLNIIEYSGVHLGAALSIGGSLDTTSAPKGPSLSVLTAGSVAISYCFVQSIALTGVTAPWSLVAIDGGSDGIADYIVPSPQTVQALFLPVTSQTFDATGTVFLPSVTFPPGKWSMGLMF